MSLKKGMNGLIWDKPDYNLSVFTNKIFWR